MSVYKFEIEDGSELDKQLSTILEKHSWSKSELLMLMVSIFLSAYSIDQQIATKKFRIGVEIAN